MSTAYGSNKRDAHARVSTQTRETFFSESKIKIKPAEPP